ncbi:hypothetical protein BD311DRAFT_763011 [Dichomitus squalens]|uniref:Uncharacterized protein n=1 Tax=Dichomitus squalens TaxID=114155 RepID=A0A4Q9MIZ6_9APHY|nr:hypothetical protein BD311DRAFT_763011 [Dichomitus squalens]
MFACCLEDESVSVRSFHSPTNSKITSTLMFHPSTSANSEPGPRIHPFVTLVPIWGTKSDANSKTTALLNFETGNMPLPEASTALRKHTSRIGIAP